MVISPLDQLLLYTELRRHKMANTYKLLSSTVLSGTATQITLSNIPQTYTDLFIVPNLRMTGGVLTTVTANNNNISEIRIRANSSGPTYDSGTGTSIYYIAEYDARAANTFSNGYIHVPNYGRNGNTKTFTLNSAEGNTTTDYGAWASGGTTTTTDPITSITFTAQGNFVAGCEIYLYGVFNADVSSAPATPTIGTATASGLGANVGFTGVSNAASYVMTSSPGSITATGTTSPIYVSGLADNTSYTFTVKSQNPFGLSSASSASNSVTTTTAGWENLGSYTGTTPTITFSSIPSTYQHLAILYSIRTDQAGGGANESMWIRVNSVAGTNYGEMNITSSPANGVNSSQGVNQDSWGAFATPGATTSANNFGVGVIYIYNYADTNIKKSYSTQNGYYDETLGYYWQNYAQGAVNLTSAINEVRIQSGNFRTWATGSRISIYGIRGS